MRKIFFLILLCILCFLLYWFRGYFLTYFSENTQSTQESYSLLYQEALTRSTESIKRYSVIFFQEDMESGNGGQNFGNNERKPLFAVSDFNMKQMQMQSDRGNGDWAGASLTLPNGDFGSLNPRSSLANLESPSFGNDGFAGATGGDGACRGIIFDPCIEGKMIETSEGPWKLRKSGTPIHNSVEAIPKNIF